MLRFSFCHLKPSLIKHIRAVVRTKKLLAHRLAPPLHDSPDKAGGSILIGQARLELPAMV